MIVALSQTVSQNAGERIRPHARRGESDPLGRHRDLPPVAGVSTPPVTDAPVASRASIEDPGAPLWRNTKPKEEPMSILTEPARELHTQDKLKSMDVDEHGEPTRRSLAAVVNLLPSLTSTPRKENP